MAGRRATVANPFEAIIQTAQKAPRPAAEPLRSANAARAATKTKTKTPQQSPVRHRGDKDEAEQLRKEVARLTRENFSLATRLSARAAAPAPVDDEAAPLPPPPAHKKPARRYSVGAPSRFSLDSRLPAARRASFALVRPASKPPRAEATTPALEFVAVYGAFDGRGEGAAGSSSLRGAYAARPRELFGWGALPAGARRALPAFCCPDGVPLEIMKRGAAAAYATAAPRARVVVLAGDDAPLYIATVAVKTIERIAAALVRTQIQTAVAGDDAPPPPPLGDDICVVGERTFAAATRCPPGRAVLACRAVRQSTVVAPSVHLLDGVDRRAIDAIRRTGPCTGFWRPSRATAPSSSCPPTRSSTRRRTWSASSPRRRPTRPSGGASGRRA